LQPTFQRGLSFTTIVEVVPTASTGLLERMIAERFRVVGVAGSAESRDCSALHALATATAAAGRRVTAVVDAAWQCEASTQSVGSDCITDIILGVLEQSERA
jgi:hypothetical protein